MNDSKDIVSNETMQANTDPPQTCGTVEDLLAEYLNDFTIEGDTVIGYIDQFDVFKEIVEKMKNQGFAFSVRDSDVREKHRGKLKKNTQLDLANSNDEKAGQLPNLTVFFQLRAMPIKFFGMPFTIEKTTHYQCAYGCKYYKSKAGLNQMKHDDGSMEMKPIKKKKRVGSKKMGCLAKMTLKHITVYPQYELYVESDWRKKKMLIENLRKDLSDVRKTVERFQRFYLSVSVQSSHNHPPIIIIPKAKGQKRKTHKLLVKSNKVKKLLKQDGTVKNEVMNDGGEWCYKDLATSSLPAEQEKKKNQTGKVLNLQDENFFHTLVKFPNSQTTAYEEVEYKPNRTEVELNPFDQNENTQTIEVYEYQPTIQDLQTLFKEKLKRLYTLCSTCTNGSLLLRLAIDLEQIELQLNNDFGYPSV